MELSFVEGEMLEDEFKVGDQRGQAKMLR